MSIHNCPICTSRIRNGLPASFRGPPMVERMSMVDTPEAAAMSSRQPATEAGRAALNALSMDMSNGATIRVNPLSYILAIEDEAAAREPTLDVERLARAVRTHPEHEPNEDNRWFHYDKVYSFGSIHEHRCIPMAKRILARLADPKEKP